MSKRIAIALATTAFTCVNTAHASDILVGNYIKIGVNDKGTLGVGGNTSPGILYDGTGTGTFNSSYDYLTPGTPFEGFTITGNSGSAFSATNNNSSLGSAAISGVLTNYNGAAYNGTTYDNRAVWTGTYGGVLTVNNDYHFDDNGQQLNITTTITALTNLSGLSFARFTDPDAVATSGDSSSTNNTRGSGTVAGSDLVYAEALVSKYVIGLYSNDTTTHNTAVTSWTSSTASYLAGTSVGNGDNTIGMGFNIGTLASGGVLTLNYAYIFGTDIAAAISANSGGGGAAAAPPPSVIVAGSTFSLSQLSSGAVLPKFDGGTLTATSDTSVTSDFTVNSAGGAVDTAGHDLTFAGALTGVGVLDKVGAGVLTLTGVNANGGFNVKSGVLAFSQDSALGDDSRAVNLADNATLRVLGDIYVTHDLQIASGAKGVFDTGAHDVTLSGDILGGGALRKVGDGVLVLSGANTQSQLDIQAGTVVAESASALGAANSQIVLQRDTQFSTAANMVITQNVDVAGENTRFDTGSHVVVLGGALSGSACFTKVGTGQLVLAAPGANAIGACVEEGLLSFNSRFDGNVWVEAGGRAGGGGQIDGDVVVNGMLSPGNSPGQLVVAGSVTQSSTGTLALDIDGATPGVGAGHYDTLVLTGAGSRYTAAGTIAPILRGITGDASNTYTPKIGDAYQVVTAEGGVTGAFAAVAQPTAGLPADARFDVAYRPKAIILAVTAKSYAAVASGGAINAQQAGVVVDRLRDAAAPASATLVSGFMGLNKTQVVTLLQQAAGEIHADGLDAGLSAGRAMRGQIAARLDQAYADSHGIWGEADYDDRKVGADAYASGYSTNTTSVTLGLDHPFGERLLTGVAVSYGETDIRAGLLGEGKAFNYRAHGYASWRSGRTYVNGVVSAGSDTYKTSRELALSSGALSLSSKAQGSTISADLEAGHRLKLGPAKITLAAGLATDNASRDAVSEIGDPAGALSFGKAKRDAFEGRLGGTVESEAKVGSMILQPRASLFAVQEFGDDTSQLDASLHGQGFALSAATPGETTVRFSAALEAKLSARTRLGLGYRYAWADNAEGHTFRAVASIDW